VGVFFKLCREQLFKSKMKKRLLLISASFILLFLLSNACNSNRLSKTNPATLEVGGEAGALINQYMDKQAQEIQENLEGVSVARVAESIVLTFDSGLLFDVGSYQLRNEIRDNLVKLTKIFDKYGDTEIVIEGHTDDRGTEDYNMTLSENRAKSVYNQLVRQGVSSSRCAVIGFGESDPVADNNTLEGRQQNRRVEIIIFADKNLKKAAKRGELPRV